MFIVFSFIFVIYTPGKKKKGQLALYKIRYLGN